MGNAHEISIVAGALLAERVERSRDIEAPPPPSGRRERSN
jgi:hypothetical protein